MIDITNSIWQAQANAANWTNDRFFACMEALKASGFDPSYWEGEERWVTIAIDNNVIGYLWRRYPLVFIAQQYSDIIIEVQKDMDSLVIVAVDRPEDKVLGTDKDMLIEVDISVEIPFSAEDVWFYNNSL